MAAHFIVAAQTVTAILRQAVIALHAGRANLLYSIGPKFGIDFRTARRVG